MTPAVPDVAASGLSDENFKLRRSQKLGFGVLGLLVAMLAVFMIQNEDATVDGMTVLSLSLGSTSNLLIVQNESIQLGSAYERWLSGATTGYLLKIRRQELAQPLVRLANDSQNNDRLVSFRYLNALGVLDNFIDAAPPGVLTPAEQTVRRTNSADALKTFVYESKTFATFGSRGVDERTRQHIRDENARRRNQYVVLLVMVTLAVLVNGTLVFSRLRDFRRIRVQMENERRALDQTNVTLKRVDDELQSRIDKERIERTEQQWVDETTRSISLQFKSTVVPDKIAETVVEGLGRALGADTVIGFAFDESRTSGFVKQWNRRPETKFDESLVVEYSSDLLILANRIWSDKRVIIVPDSLQIDTSRDPIPEFAARAQQSVRSWVVAPVGHGLQVLGLLFIAMMEDARIWSAAEIELIKNTASESASAYINLRMFNQTVEMTENDAKIGRMAELDKVKNDFIENMNHELRSPLTSIIGYMEMIVGDLGPDVGPELSESLATVQRNALRLQSLIINMMQISKTDFESLAPVISTVDIGNLLGYVFKSMELDADDKGVGLTLRLESPSGDLLIDGDLNRLQQVFVNLLSNAIKYTPRGGKVTVVARHVHTDSEYVEVTIADTGIGISPDEFPNMFKRFFRASTATQASIPGFGIGLSLVHAIISEHHGTITFDSTVGTGTMFTVRLPVRFESTGISG